MAVTEQTRSIIRLCFASVVTTQASLGMSDSDSILDRSLWCSSEQSGPIRDQLRLSSCRKRSFPGLRFSAGIQVISTR